MYISGRYLGFVGLGRIVIGIIFLWAGLEKVLGSGAGGFDTAMTVINVLVPSGQIGIGVSLILGLFTRFGAAMGTLMMIFFFFAAWDFEFGIVNQHLTYAVVTFGLAVMGAGNFYGLDAIVGQRVGPTFRRWICSGDKTDPDLAPPMRAAA